MLHFCVYIPKDYMGYSCGRLKNFRRSDAQEVRYNETQFEMTFLLVHLFGACLGLKLTNPQNLIYTVNKILDHLL